MRIIGALAVLAGAGLVVFEVLSKKKEIVVEVDPDAVVDETPASTESDDSE